MKNIDGISTSFTSIPDPVKVFLCYSREDEALRKRLEQHLEPMRREGLIIIWCDRDISAGKDFLQEIRLHLDTSDILLALVSPAFMSSNYCYDVELRRALDKHIFGELHIIPIIIKPVEWKNTPLGKLQALPLDAKPVTKWKNIDDGLKNVAQGIRDVAKGIQNSKPAFNPVVARRYYMKGVALADYCFDDHVLLEEAIVAFKMSIRYDHTSTVAWESIASLLNILGRYEEALLVCERIIQIDPAYDIYFTKLNALEKLGRVEEVQQLRDSLKSMSIAAIEAKGFYCLTKEAKRICSHIDRILNVNHTRN